MKLKRFIVAGFAGGLVILIASMVFQMAVQAVWPFNILSWAECALKTTQL